MNQKKNQVYSFVKQLPANETNMGTVDDDIVMPEGPPPEEEESDDSDDDIPMPEGPPPPKPGQQGMTSQRPTVSNVS